MKEDKLRSERNRKGKLRSPMIIVFEVVSEPHDVALACVIEGRGVVVCLCEAIVARAETHCAFKFVPRFVILTRDEANIVDWRSSSLPSDALHKRYCDEQMLDDRVLHGEMR